jgi:hypothetical protein
VSPILRQASAPPITAKTTSTRALTENQTKEAPHFQKARLRFGHAEIYLAPVLAWVTRALIHVPPASCREGFPAEVCEGVGEP